jgi:hypothetical protein
MHGDSFVVWLVVFVAVALWGGFTFLSPDARLRRRRRKSNRPIVSRTNRPSVKFSVKPPKEKE